MALSPEIEIVENAGEISIDELAELKTFRFDFETKRLTSELISGLEAAKQFIMMSLHITRYAHAIYSPDTGNELKELIADKETSIAFKKIEIERYVTEALIYDVRIESVHDFDIKHIGNAFHVSFKVDTVFGGLEIEEVLVT